MKRSPLSITLLLLPALLLVPRSATRAQDSLPPLVEGFETLVGGVPIGWVNDSYGEVRVTTHAENRRPREGAGCWRVEVPAWDAGAMRVRRGGLTLRAGGGYAVEVWLRGEGLSTPVTVSLAAQSGTGAPYLSRRFAVGPAWRRCTLEGRCPSDDPGAGLAISMAGPGVLYVDALRILPGELPVEPAPVAPDPTPGNRIFNSSFELGMDGWTIPEQVALVRNACPDGERFARWLPGRYPLQARPFAAVPDQRYTVSASLRSQRPDARAEMALIEVGNAARAAQSFALTTEWKRFSFTTTLPCREYARYFLSIQPAGEAHGIDVDAVQVEEGTLRDYAPAAPIEVSAGLNRGGLFPEPDQVVGVPVQFYARGGAPADTSIRCRLEGFQGETLFLQRLPVRQGAIHSEIPVRLRIPAAGTLRLVIEGMRGQAVASRAEAILTALPPLNPKPDPRSFFGAHGSVGTAGEWHAPTVAARAGVRWWRLHDLSAYTQWAVAEPEPGRFVWYDREIAALRSRGLSILGVFARTPTWAGKDPGGERSDPTAWPPARMADLSAYVSRVTSHYRGRIAAYEIWNEPWARAFWAGTPEQYADLAAAASRAARAGDPAARIVGGCFWVPRPAFTDRVLARGLLPGVEVISHHQYSEPDSVAYSHGGRDQITQWNQTLRGKLGLIGRAKTPIWNTEGGVPCPSFHSWLGAETQARAAARVLAKTLILNRASGVERFFYYHVWQEIGLPRLFDWLHTNNWALLDYDGSGKPTLGAYAACARSLEGAEPAGRFETADVKAYLFSRGSETVAAVWSPTALREPRELTLAIDPLRVRAMDLMGNVKGVRGEGRTVAALLRNEPLYIHLRDTAPAAALRALRLGTGGS